MVVALEAKSGEIKMEFPFFIEKAAPVSQVEKLDGLSGNVFGACAQERIFLCHESCSSGEKFVSLFKGNIRVWGT